MQPDEVVHRLPEKAGAGDGAYPHFPCQHVAKFQVAGVAELGDVQQDVVRALGVGVGDADGVQAVQEQVFFGGVLVLEPFIIVVSKPQAAAPTVRKSWTFLATSMM